jgi:hypothetical protein
MVFALAAIVIAVLAVGESGSAATSYDSEEIRFLRLINDYRQENGAGPLILFDTLAVAAEHHSEDMGQYGFFAHNTEASSYYRVGAKPWDRMAAEGYNYNTSGARTSPPAPRQPRRPSKLGANRLPTTRPCSTADTG